MGLGTFACSSHQPTKLARTPCQVKDADRHGLGDGRIGDLSARVQFVTKVPFGPRARFRLSLVQVLSYSARSERPRVFRDRLRGTSARFGAYGSQPSASAQKACSATLIENIGLPAARVKDLVPVGSPVTMMRDFVEVGEAVSCKAMDNRLALYIMIRAMQQARRFAFETCAVATTQEEIGLRGAQVSAFGVEPDLGVAIDITIAADIPGVDDHLHVTRLGGGAAIKILDSSHISHPGLVECFRSLDEERSIKYQWEILPHRPHRRRPRRDAGSGGGVPARSHRINRQQIFFRKTLTGTDGIMYHPTRLTGIGDR